MVLLFLFYAVILLLGPKLIQIQIKHMMSESCCVYVKIAVIE